MVKGFKNFLMRGDIVVIAIGLVVALAFSTLIAAFTTNVINPLVTRAQGGGSAAPGDCRVATGQVGEDGCLAYLAKPAPHPPSEDSDKLDDDLPLIGPDDD